MYLLITCLVCNPQNPPTEFNNATDAMEFILKLPTVMAYGGYDATKLSDEEIIDFANDLIATNRIN